MLAGVAGHALANWPAFKRYFLTHRTGRLIIGLSIVVLAASFFAPPGGRQGPPPQIMALKAVTKAPISSVAALSGRTTAQVLEDLAKAGINLPGADASLDSVLANNRELQAKAMGVLFGTR